MKGFLQVFLCYNLLLLFFASSIQAQDVPSIEAQIDSLNAMSSSEIDSEKEQKKIFQQAVDLSIQIKDKERIAESKINLGSYYLRRGTYDKALSLFQEANVLAKKVTAKRVMAEANYFIGNTYSYLGNQERSLGFVEISKGLFTELGDKIWLGKVCNQLGAIHGRMDNYEESANAFADAAQIFEDLGKLRYMLTPLFNQGMTYHNTSKWEKAEPIFEKCLATSKELGLSNIKMEALYGLGLVANAKSKQKKSLEYYFQSLKLAEELDLPYSIQDNYKGIYESYAALNNFAKAFEFAEKYHAIKDTLTGTETQKNINELQVKYDTGLKERAIIEKDKELLEFRNKAFLRNAIIIGLVGGLLFGLLFFLQYNSKAQKEKDLAEAHLKNTQLEKEKVDVELKNKQLEISFKNMELSKMGLYLVEKVDFLVEIGLNLEQLKEKLTIGHVDQLIKAVRGRQQYHTDLERFKVYIEENNQNFFFKLESYKLSKGEKRLASLLLLNFPTKDIAILNNSTAGSVRLARHRLRKKLALSEEQDLVVFLQNL